MKLQLNTIDIRDVRFSNRTKIEKGLLLINKKELEGFLLKDKRLNTVEIVLAKPGESCRIIRVIDVIEPRAKIEENLEDFPGALGKQGTAGTGSTCVLRGTAVVTSSLTNMSKWHQDGEVIDMKGPNAELSPFGKTLNIVLVTSPADGIISMDYKMAVKMAGLKTSVYLAGSGKDVEPDEVVALDLSVQTKKRAGSDKLPNIAYIFQIIATQHDFIPQDPILYGGSIEKLVPTILHPNEVLDGAVIAPFQALGMRTYSIQNNPVIRALYRGHGRELYFSGVIAAISSENQTENKRSAIIAGNLAKEFLKADGVLLTKSGGGAPEIAAAEIAQRCEQLGIKTTLAQWQHAADFNDPKGSFIVFNMSEVDAIVSMGTPWEEISLPIMEKVIGSDVRNTQSSRNDGEDKRFLRTLVGAWDQLGGGRLRIAVH